MEKLFVCNTKVALRTTIWMQADSKTGKGRLMLIAAHSLQLQPVDRKSWLRLRITMALIMLNVLPCQESHDSSLLTRYNDLCLPRTARGSGE